MLALNWIVFALLGLLWTGAAWITATATDWMAAALASGAATGTVRDLATLPLPAWTQIWVDPEWLIALQSFVQWLADLAASGGPWVSVAMQWLVPAIWIAWGIGALLLLLGAVCVHLLVRRFAPRRAVPPATAG